MPADEALVSWVKGNSTMQSVTRYTGDFAWSELASATNMTHA